MARIRTLKPEFFRSRSMARVSRDARLTFQGLWCEADDFGRGVADPRILKGAIWPLDDDLGWEEVGDHLDELAGTGHIVLYEVDGDAYFHIPTWEEHQAAAYRRGKAVHPAPPDTSLHDESCKEVQDARPDVLELGTVNEEPLAPAERAQDAIFDALVEVCGIDASQLTPSARGSLNAARKAIADLGASDEDVRRKADAYRVEFPSASLTPSALAKHWPMLGGARKPAAPKGPEPTVRIGRDGGTERFFPGTGWVSA